MGKSVLPSMEGKHYASNAREVMESRHTPRCLFLLFYIFYFTKFKIINFVY